MPSSSSYKIISTMRVGWRLTRDWCWFGKRWLRRCYRASENINTKVLDIQVRELSGTDTSVCSPDGAEKGPGLICQAPEVVHTFCFNRRENPEHAGEK
ncbi:hypothetical protein RRG08_012286 [Elysia crispata]|uniref:Uncharacterized protein n=1 Tax=Elysia crispata TaxID=231223 RepID=A0AAE1EDC6_9GAST|nr:hypothetical protein RRG08_012286 [Elysia crispata]